MKILVTGYTGQLGYDVVNEGLKRGFNMIGISSKQLDITDKEKVLNYIKQVRPDAIIHCAAYTAVDSAEVDKKTCWNVNVEGSRYLAMAASVIEAKFMYISSDYVFNGEGESPFIESDIPEPKGYYGLTKLIGEEVVKSIVEKWYIVRVSWVFGINGNNFIKTMLKLAETRNEINVVGDQVGSPTYTLDLSYLLLDMIQTEKFGLYNASNEGFCSWAEFAEEIFKKTGKNIHINYIKSSEYPSRAIRPNNSRMSKQKLIDNGFEPLPSWKQALGHYLEELKQGVEK